jgi:hypothetical protein
MAGELKNLAPEEAVNYLIRRGADLRPSWNWQEVWQEEHARAFAVAKMTQTDLLQEVHRQVVASVQEGITLDEFKKRLVPILQKEGWWGQKKVDGEVVQLGSPERLKVIYDTNLRQAYAAGQWERFQRTKADLPFLLYGLGPSRRHRVTHAGWEGTILPVDDPWWDTHAPMNGWGCKCWLRQLTAAAAARLGYDPDRPAPADRMRSFTKADGEVVQVPEGIDPGFAYNPGKAGMRSARLGEVLGDKLLGADAPVASRMLEVGGADLTASLQAAYRPWAQEIADELVQPQGQRMVVGALTPVVERAMEQLVEALTTSAITMEDREIFHVLRASKVARGAALSREDVLRIPELLASAKATLWDLAQPSLLYVFDVPGEGMVGKLVVRVNYQVRARRETLTVNTIPTGGLVPLSNLTTSRFKLLEGSL